jgi:hypothetical protein
MLVEEIVGIQMEPVGDGMSGSKTAHAKGQLGRLVLPR